MPEGSQESNQHGILASMDVDQSSDAKKENGTSLALTSVLENLRNQMGGVSRSELCLRVIKINVTKGVKSYVFVNAVNDDGYCVELAAYDDIAVKKLKETAKQSGILIVNLCRVKSINSKFNNVAKFQLLCDKNTKIKSVSELSGFTGIEVNSFAEIKEGALVNGKFYVLTELIGDYMLGQKSGTLFDVGDSDHCRAIAFVCGENRGLIKKINDKLSKNKSPLIKFSKALAKYEATELWLTFEDCDDLEKPDESKEINTPELSNYRSPRTKPKEQAQETTKDHRKSSSWDD